MNSTSITDEQIHERNYFWATAHPYQGSQHPELKTWWERFAPSEPKFTDILQIITDFESSVGEEDLSIEEDAVDLFVMQSLWIGKCERGLDAFADKNIGLHLLSNDCYQWLKQAQN